MFQLRLRLNKLYHKNKYNNNNHIGLIIEWDRWFLTFIYLDNKVRDILLVVKNLKSLKFILDVSIKTEDHDWIVYYKILEFIIFVHNFI